MNQALLKIAAAVLVAVSAGAVQATEYRHDDHDGKKWEKREVEFCREAYKFLKQYGEDEKFKRIKIRFVRECKPYWAEWREHHHKRHVKHDRDYDRDYDRDDRDGYNRRTKVNPDDVK